MQKAHKPIFAWLLTGCFLIAAMVIIGGITRLTQSGLSMVEWKLIMGSVPPLNESQWQDIFDKYKAFPEYMIVNKHFTLEEFKSIFWWEYIHRMLGRLIGLAFIIPFLFFLIQNRISGNLLKKLIILFIIGAFQGFLGWFMVKSGLVNDPHVSHLRLAIHLIAAFTASGYSLWIALDLKSADSLPSAFPGHLKKVLYAAFALLIVQIVYGAFVAGLKAGLYYNTWPLMNGVLIPGEVWNALQREGISSLLNNVTSVQFIHRTLGLIVGLLIFYFVYISRKEKANNISIDALALVVIVQIILGIYTLIYQVPVVLGVIHQFGSLILFSIFIYIMHWVNNRISDKKDLI